jgi:hypothetical protein
MISIRSFIVAVAMTAFLFSGATTAQELAGPNNSAVFVKVSKNRELSGDIVALTDMKIQTSFGEVSIPLEKIDGIKMHADADDSAVIAFKNGDLVTGKILLEKLQLKTEWGTAHILTEKIETVMTSSTAKFFSDTTGGRQSWRFSKSPTAGTANGR